MHLLKNGTVIIRGERGQMLLSRPLASADTVFTPFGAADRSRHHASFMVSGLASLDGESAWLAPYRYS